MLDYQNLSVLSDATKIQTCQTLSGLRHRLSQQYRSTKVPGNRKEGSPLHTLDQPQPRSKAKNATKNKPSPGRGQVSNKIHWAVVRTRPKHPRKQSASSTGSSGSSAIVASQTPKVRSPQLATQPRRKQKPHRVSMPEKRLASAQATPGPSKLALHHAVTPGWFMETSDHTAAPHPNPIPRRRGKQPTDSFYSFASDSTKIGEIPFHKLPVPFDFEAVERFNESADQAPGMLEQSVNPRQGKKRGFFAKMLLRRHAEPPTAET